MNNMIVSAHSDDVRHLETDGRLVSLINYIRTENMKLRKRPHTDQESGILSLPVCVSEKSNKKVNFKVT